MSEVERNGPGGITGPAPCPFCGEALAGWFGGPEYLDQAEQCPRCLAAILFTTDPEDAAHRERLSAALMEFLPPEGAALDARLRVSREVGRLAGAGQARAVHLLAAWNLEEYVSLSMASAILREPRAGLVDLLQSGVLAGVEEADHSPYGGSRSSWLIPRAALLQYLDTLRDEG